MTAQIANRMRSKFAVAIFAALSCISGAVLADGSGRYLNSNYTYTQKVGVVVAAFKPFLPRDDTINWRNA